MDDGLYGCYVYGSTTAVGLENDNRLYFPRISEDSGCEGYWLISPYAGNTSCNLVVWCDGSIDRGNYQYDYACSRPAVYLNSNIRVEKAANGVWQIR